jgi:hypothetical protein
MTRWDVERAVLASDLSPQAKLVMLVLLVHADARTLDTGKFSPSLTGLANATGLGRSTVARELNHLERSGWVVRVRPSSADARSKRARTAYRLTSPTAGPVPHRDQTSPRVGLVQSQSGTSTSPTAGHRTDQSDQGQISLQATRRVIEVLEEIGGRPVDERHAARVAKDLAPRATKDPLNFVEKCIRNDPERFLPTPTPPRFTAAHGFGD